MLEKDRPIRFLLRSLGESEDRTKGSRRLFAYFLVGEKVWPRSDRKNDFAVQCVNSEERIVRERIATTSLRTGLAMTRYLNDIAVPGRPEPPT